MPSYHFRIKSDKKRNGARVSAGTHERYIDRQGKYADYDEKQVERLQYTNVITGDHPIEHLPGRELILYKSPFGCIKQDDTGIRVSQNASVETVAIALSVARNIYGDNLSVQGSPRFEGSSVTAACEMELPVHFQEAALEDARLLQQEEENLVRQNYEQSGGRTCELRHPAAGAEQFRESRTPRRTLANLAEEGLRLPALSERHLVPSGGRASVLLHGDEVRDVLNRRRERTARVRWNGGRARRLMVERTARDIMVNVQQQSDTVFASSHVQYINRESAFKQRGGCVFTAHHLPRWAKDDPKIFFDAADRFERANGERYKEIEFSLPNELDLSAQKEIIEQFIERHLKNCYYAFAIHDKVGSMSNGERHPHVHIMFSTREMDKVEKTHERSPEMFFRRANAMHPEKGGCPKAEKWNGKNRVVHLMEMRKDFADIQNAVLAKNGIALRVNHRSLKHRRQEALANGNYLLAELLNRVPESSVGPMALLEKDNALVRGQKALRKLNQQHEKNVIVRAILQDELDEAEVQQRLEELPSWLSDIRETLPSIKDAKERARLTETFERLTERVSKTSSMEQAVVWSAQVIENTKLDAMTLPERELWQRIKENGREKKHWQDFLSRLRLPRIHTVEEEQQHAKIRYEVQKTIRFLNADLRKDAETLRPVFERLQQPSTRKAMYQQISKTLSEVYPYKQRTLRDLRVQEREIRQLDASVRLALEKEGKETTYSIDDISALLESSMQEKKASLRRMKKQLAELGKKVISEKRALAMAKTLFLDMDGEWSKFVKLERNFKKYKHKLPEKEQQRKEKLLEEFHKVFDEHCASEFGQRKIAQISAGILRKNEPIRQRYQELEMKIKMLEASIQQETGIAEEVQFQSLVQDAGTRYRMVPQKEHGSGGGMTFATPLHQAHQIARAICDPNDVGVVNLVMRNKPDEPDEWSLMSEAEKDDLRNDTASLDRY